MSTIVSILTPLGEGGIGVVALFGSHALDIANRIFRGTRVKDLTTLPSGRICHGFIVDAAGPVDEVIVHVSRGSTPVSDLVEINCHGGIVPVRKVLELCVQQGAHEAPPEDFVVRISAERCGLDRIQQDALRELPRARTEMAALVLLDQFNGALSSALRAIIARLESSAKADEDVIHRLQELIDSASLGVALTRPRRLVVVGKPNVGKSTLVNALLAEERTLVHHLPGTTRDAVASMVEIAGVPFELVDTAGIRQFCAEHAGASEAKPSLYLEMLGIEQTWREVAQADLLLVLLDRSRPADVDDARILAAVHDRDRIIVLTKIDLPPALDLGVLGEIAATPACAICAKTGEGLDALCQCILTRIGYRRYEPGRPMPFTDTQVRALKSALTALKESAAHGGAAIRTGLSHIQSLFSSEDYPPK